MSEVDQFSYGPDAPPGQFMIPMLAQVVPEAQIVEFVMAPGQDIPGFPLAPWSAPGVDHARFSLVDGVVAGLRRKSTRRSFSRVIADTSWRVLVESVRAADGEVVGALFVARERRMWSSWERSLLKTFGAVLSQDVALTTREQALLQQRRLDGLVGEIAERLMSTSSQTRQEVLTWTMRTLSEYLDVYVAMLQRHDHASDMSVIEAEWPVAASSDRTVATHAPSDADRVVFAMNDPREPVVTELSMSHFRHRKWAAEELRMLQAVGTLLMQLQARLDAEAQTLHHALHDELTGLPNRRALLSELSERLAERKTTAILFFDLDRFKVMNDFLGHASGDSILSTVADRIRSTIGPDDYAARLGGDEFVVLLSEVNNEKESHRVAGRILDVLRQPIDFAGQQISHSASIGIVLSSPGVNNGMELIGWADIALYAAKRRGGNQAVLFDEDLRESVSKRSHTELALRQAIEGGGLYLHYQPEVDLRTGELLAVEALVRWQHPTLGLLPASAFMSIAEEAGLVVDLGRWVFTEACRQLAKWQTEYPDLAIDVRVNVSPSQFMVGDYVKVVANCLRSFRVPGERLCIEIAERALLQEPEQTARVVQGVRTLGLEVAIDDFGTNYASFAELKRLPVNYLKLCPDFVQGIGQDVVDRAIVETITKLAGALDLGVIAKGIERGETIDKLIDLSCTRGQGSFIAVPMSAGDLAPILRSGFVRIGSDHRAESVRPHDRAVDADGAVMADGAARSSLH